MDGICVSAGSACNSGSLEPSHVLKAINCPEEYIHQSIRLSWDDTLTDEEIEAKFGFLVEAYKYGAPPHGGLGIGLDRLAMVMLQAENLRDVVAFPKVQNASELMSACPSTVDKESLDVLGIAVTAENDD